MIYIWVTVKIILDVIHIYSSAVFLKRRIKIRCICFLMTVFTAHDLSNIAIYFKGSLHFLQVRENGQFSGARLQCESKNISCALIVSIIISQAYRMYSEWNDIVFLSRFQSQSYCAKITNLIYATWRVTHKERHALGHVQLSKTISKRSFHIEWFPDGHTNKLSTKTRHEFWQTRE